MTAEESAQAQIFNDESHRVQGFLNGAVDLWLHGASDKDVARFLRDNVRNVRVNVGDGFVEFFAPKTGYRNVGTISHKIEDLRSEIATERLRLRSLEEEARYVSDRILRLEKYLDAIAANEGA